MADGINVTIRLDREIKEQAEKMFNDFGMNLSTAFNIFARQALKVERDQIIIAQCGGHYDD